MRFLVACMVVAACLGGCGEAEQTSSQGGPSNSRAQIGIDGSSTVGPITLAALRAFAKANPAWEFEDGRDHWYCRSPDAEIALAGSWSGTGGGFREFCQDNTQISNASRPIKEAEQQDAILYDVDFVELPIAYDGIAVVVSKKNDFIDHLTTDELFHMFRREQPAQTWKDLRAEWPDEQIRIHAPGVDSGTYDYFCEAIVKPHTGQKKSRPDYDAREDDDLLAREIEGSTTAIGFFGFAYLNKYPELRAVPIKHGDADPVAPSEATIGDGTYKPLSRPLFIYVNNQAADEKPALADFVDFYLQNLNELVAAAGYVTLPPQLVERVQERWEARLLGSLYADAANKDKSLEYLLGAGGH